MSEFRQIKRKKTALISVKNDRILSVIYFPLKAKRDFMLQTRTDVKSGPCYRCRIIRSFVLFTLMLVILALVAGKKFEVINFLTPTYFAAGIITIGASGFLIKLISWKIFKKII